jgi:hypothetical protein
MSRRYYLDFADDGGLGLRWTAAGPAVGAGWVEVASCHRAQVPIRRGSDLVEQAVSWANRTKFVCFGGGLARRDRGFTKTPAYRSVGNAPV